MVLPVKKINCAHSNNKMVLNGYPTLVVAIHEASISQHIDLREIPICRQRTIDLAVRLLYIRRFQFKNNRATHLSNTLLVFRLLIL